MPLIDLEDGRALQADLAVPADAVGVVAFAHGSGSSRRSRRNIEVAEHLQRAGLGTLLLDLLTEIEERDEAVDGRLRFDIELLAERFGRALTWLADQPDTASRSIGAFGASTGAAAALVAAARRPDLVRAVVSRGGRPDLAGGDLPAVEAPTLFIVGGDDQPVLDLNRQAEAQLRATHHLEIVPGASHLFAEPGALDRVAELATAWFLTYLTSDGSGSPGRS